MLGSVCQPNENLRNYLMIEDEDTQLLPRQLHPLFEAVRRPATKKPLTEHPSNQQWKDAAQEMV